MGRTQSRNPPLCRGIDFCLGFAQHFACRSPAWLDIPSDVLPQGLKPPDSNSGTFPVHRNTPCHPGWTPPSILNCPGIPSGTGISFTHPCTNTLRISFALTCHPTQCTLGVLNSGLRVHVLITHLSSASCGWPDGMLSVSSNIATLFIPTHHLPDYRTGAGTLTICLKCTLCSRRASLGHASHLQHDDDYMP
jgi:hypothetical protein